MFTGLIEEVGKVKSILPKGSYSQLLIEASHVLVDQRIGDSMAVNGVCLTITQCDRHSFAADVVQETLSVTSLGELKENDPVNLERPLLPSSRLGGHFVTGHVDCLGTIQSIKPSVGHYDIWIGFPAKHMDEVVRKGSITIDGISLTVAACHEASLMVTIIPHTLQKTNLSHKKEGDAVNLEMDILGKYVLQSLKRQQDS